MALIAAVVVAALFWLPNLRRQDLLARAFVSADARLINTKPGQRGSFKLGDGTTVTLGADTRLTVPPGFTEEVRAVRLEGTASFQVPGGSELPFRVVARDVIISTSSTLFDVSAWPGDRTVLVRVREGSLEVARDGRQSRLESGASVAVSPSGATSTPSAAELAQAFGWLDGEISVSDRPLRDVLPILRRWYDLVLTPVDSAMLDRRVTMRAGIDSMGAAIRALQKAGSVQVDYDGKKNRMHDVAPSRRQ
jgi:ferric-dicitrate binding protein FerR (iron transport regulator)